MNSGRFCRRGGGRGRRGAGEARRRRASPPNSRKSFTIFKNGHVYGFVYRPGLERAALEAFAECPAADAMEITALACYLGHDPRTLDLDPPK